MNENKIPAKQELTVMSTDNPNDRKLGFTIRERMGVSIYKAPENYQNGFKEDKLETITDPNGLEHGQLIFIPGLMGGYHVMTVEKDSSGAVSARDEKTMAVLEFEPDDRNCWICGGLINLRGLERFGKSSKND